MVPDAARVVPAPGLWAAGEGGRLAPAWGAVVGEEVRKVGLALRKPGEFAAAGLLVLTVLFTYLHIATGKPVHWAVYLFPIALMLGGLIGRVWFENGIAKRGYMWALPVGRTRSQLTVVLAGWLWLVAVLAVYLAWAGTLYRLTGGVTSSDPSPDLLFPALTSPLDYAVYFAGATVFYLFASAVAGSIRQPFVGAGWVYFAVVLPIRLMRDAEVPIARFFADELFGRGRFGITTALTGQGALDPKSGVVDAAVWLPAVGVWLAIGLVVVGVASSVHREI